MNEKLDSASEEALINLNKYGLKPQNRELEQLIKMGLVENTIVDGWVLSPKGIDYISTL